MIYSRNQITILIVVALLIVGAGVLWWKPTAPEAMVPVGTDDANGIPVRKDFPKTTQGGVDAGTSIDWSNSGLTKIEASFFSTHTNITELNFSNSSISGALPAEVRLLQNLRVLNLSHNLMTGVPAEIGQLENLETLDLSYNKLTGLPSELGNLKNLKILNLVGNTYSTQDLEGIRTRIPQATVITR